MSQSTSNRRSYGTGTLYSQATVDGQEVWYGRWHLAGKRPNRRLGLKRRPGGGVGLNRSEAEIELRRRMVCDRPPAVGSSLSFARAAELMLRDLEALGRKPTTLGNYRAILRAHLLPRFGEAVVGEVEKSEIEAFMATLSEAGKGERTRAGVFKLLSQVFSFAQRHGWCEQNPCRSVGRPRVRECSEIRFLNQAELDALIAAVDVSEELFGSTDRAIFLTGAMTGMRQGELLALRWRDVDWEAKRIRVRRSFTRGYWLTPKSRSGERAVPLSGRVEAELRAHFRRARFTGEDDLVFGDPMTGEVLPHSPLVHRFKKTLKAAGVRPIRFHDLRHTFGTRIAAAGVPMRVLQEWMGHRDYRTTLIYADYEPGDEESGLVDAAFSAPPAARNGRPRSRAKQRLPRLRNRFTARRRHRDRRFRARRAQPLQQDPHPR